MCYFVLIYLFIEFIYIYIFKGILEVNRIKIIKNYYYTNFLSDLMYISKVIALTIKTK